MTNLKRLSDNEVTETTNCLYRVLNTIESDFLHVKDFLSQEFRDKLSDELYKFVEEENKRPNS